MTIKSDLTNRYFITDEFEDVKLHVDIRNETVELYLGHTHPAVNERLEALEASIMFDGDTLDDLIELLMRCRVEMNSINFIESTKRAIERELFTLKTEGTK